MRDGTSCPEAVGLGIYGGLFVNVVRSPRISVRGLILLNDQLEDLTVTYRFGFYFFGNFPDVSYPRMKDNVIATNWPSQLIAKYDRTDLLRESKVLAVLSRSVSPIQISALLHACSTVETAFRGPVPSYRDDNFKLSVALPLFDAAQRHYALIFSGARPALEPAELGTLVVGCMKAVDGYMDASEETSGLAARELDCLRWAAAGKSSEETAIILSLSAHTVNSYLKSAIQKLGAVNRVQAVAIAVKLGLI